MTEVQSNRELAVFIKTVMASFDMPILSRVGSGRWQIVKPDGEAMGEEHATPWLAWQSAALRVKAAT